MGIKDCKIVLDNHYNSYYPGQTINGHVEYIFDAVKKVKGIKVTIKGEAETYWTEKREETDTQGKKTTCTVHKTGNEEYFSMNYYVLGGKSDDKIEIPSGAHRYSFAFALPPTLPSSFEGEFGFVRYTIKATLERPWKFDQETKMAFTVVGVLDLNLNPENMKPMTFHIDKTFCCCWCKSGPVNLDVGVPVSGFCSGQTIPLDINCENGSSVDITDIKIKFVKKCTYHCSIPSHDTNSSSVTINKIDAGNVPANTTRTFNKSLQIPPLPPSNLDHCNIIDLKYELVVILSPSGMHMDKEVSKKIIIGTVPLQGFEPPPSADENTLVNPIPIPIENAPLISASAPPETPDIANISRPFLQNYSSNTNNYPSSGYPPYPSSGYPPYPMPNSPAVNPPYPQGGYSNTAAPIFQESQFGTTSIQSKGDSTHVMYQGNKDFAPSYPVYGFYLPPK